MKVIVKKEYSQQVFEDVVSTSISITSSDLEFFDEKKLDQKFSLKEVNGIFIKVKGGGK